MLELAKAKGVSDWISRDFDVCRGISVFLGYYYVYVYCMFSTFCVLGFNHFGCYFWYLIVYPCDVWEQFTLDLM